MSQQPRNDVNGSTSNGTNSTYSIRCTYPGCRCAGYKISPSNPRQCSGCLHGYVPHAFDQLGIVLEWDKKKLEAVDYNAVFDIASLILYGTTGIPLRLHICLFRLMIGLPNGAQDATRIASQFDWSWDDVCRGYKFLNADGTMRSSWSYADLTDETMILMHFLKYQPTQTVAEKFIHELLQQKKEDNPYLGVFNKPPESGLQMFFSQNQTKPVASPVPSIPNGVLHAPFNGFPQASVGSTSGVPNGKPIVLSSPQQQSRQLNGSHDVNNTMPNGMSLSQNVSSLIFRTNLPNGSFQLHPVHHQMDLGQVHQAQTQQGTHQQVICQTAGPAPVAPPMPAITSTPGKRTLKPKPAAVVPVAPLTIKTESSLATPLTIPSTSPSTSSLGPVPKKIKTDVTSPEPGSSSSQSGVKQQKAPARRVYCDNCQKSFCDKGALKIHYSAVHLKEMHRCTTPGCNMMFSSRRSRNRHSSNPNPRLHSNLFAPRRGGILLGDGEVPPQSNDGSDNNDQDYLSGDDDDRSMSYDEVATMSPAPQDLSCSRNSPGTGEEGKLVMALEDGDLLDQMEVDGHEPITVVTMEKQTLNGNASYLTASVPLTLGSPVTATHFVSQHLNGHNNDHSSRNGSEAADSLTKFHDDLDEDGDSEQSEAALESLGAVLPTANRDEHGKIIVPVDGENSSRCPACSKVFKNHFTVRTHYINVHLRVMHMCTVPGCRSAFPSVRSRDRHSANLNLHDGKAPASSPEVAAPTSVAPAFIG